MTSDRAVVVGFDENYLMPGLVAATTALEHCPDDVGLVILGVGLSDKARKQLRELIPPNRLTIVDAGQYAAGMREWRYISSAAWGRIGMGSLLPSEIRRVVYLDADTLEL